jgi:hypothetical protein
MPFYSENVALDFRGRGMGLVGFSTKGERPANVHVGRRLIYT